MIGSVREWMDGGKYRGPQNDLLKNDININAWCYIKVYRFFYMAYLFDFFQ